MAKIVFYCNDDRENISIFEYYSQDIKALEQLGHEVVVCTKYRELPLKFDYIYIWWWTYALWPVLFARITGAKSIVTGAFNFNFPESFKGIDYFHRPIWQRILIRLATKLANINIFINDFEQKACRDYFGLKHTFISPCVVNPNYFNSEKSSTDLPFLFNIAWSGMENLSRKGIPEILEAVKILKDQSINVHVKLAGKEGDGFSWLQNRIKELGIERNVELLGKISNEQKVSLFESCIAYVQPSHYEGFGLGIAEAMSASCCVLVCDAGAVKTVVGDSGLYVSPNDPTDLAEKIKEVVTNNSLRIKLEASAYKHAVSNFSIDAKLLLFKQIIK